MSVSAGATLYVFLCIFSRERRRSGSGRRCRKQPPVSEAKLPPHLLPSLSDSLPPPTACCSLDAAGLIDGPSSLIFFNAETSSAGSSFYSTCVKFHSFLPALPLSSPSRHITPALGLVCPFSRIRASPRLCSFVCLLLFRSSPCFPALSALQL